MDLQGIARLLLIAAAVLAAVGLVMLIGARLGLGSLPGDIRLGGRNWSCYVPIATSIVLSVVLTIVLSLIARFMGK